MYTQDKVVDFYCAQKSKNEQRPLLLAALIFFYSKHKHMLSYNNEEETTKCMCICPAKRAINGHILLRSGNMRLKILQLIF